MNDDLRLTDHLIKDMLERRSRRGTADGLRRSILGVTSTAHQRSGHRATFGLGRALRMLAIAAVVGGAVTTGLLVAGFPRTPPALTYGAFVRPFSYPDLPAAALGEPVRIGYLVAFPPTGMAGPYPTVEAADGSNVIQPHAHGIVIASTDDAVTHPCPMDDGQPSRVPFREDPEGVLEDLRTIGGAGIGELESITFDGRPALAATVDPSASRCDYSDFHVLGSSGIGQGYMRLNLPSRLIVTQVAGMTIVLQAWAASPDDLDDWLPTATEFLDRVRFTGASYP